MTLSKPAGAALLLILLAGAARAGEPAAAATAAAVVVEVKNLRNASGALGCRLHASGEGFPDNQGQERTAPIKDGAATCRFEGLAPGTYAVSVMHDENGNQKLDKNFLGVPTEGYGVSNNKTYSLSAPKWDESKFTVAAGETRTLDVVLRY
jgi:uncharacterized protein (DUF2141 family)